MIELINISKYYANFGISGQTLILDDISLKIETGDAIAITGPSGSGKSTLLNIMGTLDNATSGKVIINNLYISSLSDNELAEIRNSHIGFIFQRHYLLPQLNLIENVLLPVIPLKDKTKKKLAWSRGLNLLELVGLADKAVRLPGQLSVGECQRAAVVRALINQPQLILADEPTGSLDNNSASELGELMVTLNKTLDVTLILVTHSTELAKKMKKNYKLSKGKLLMTDEDKIS